MRLKLNKRVHRNSLCNFFSKNRNEKTGNFLKALSLARNRKAQVATTITWIVATIIIIVILGISMLVTAAFGKRTYNDNDLNERTDLLIAKSLFSYLLTKDSSGKLIFEQLSEQENLNDFNGNLALNVFKKLYSKDYPYEIWFGIRYNRLGQNKNNFFGKASTEPGFGVGEEIKINQGKSIILTLSKRAR